MLIGNLDSPNQHLLEIFGILREQLPYQALVGYSVVDGPLLCVGVRVVD